MTYDEIVNFIWGIANLIRDTFKRGKYQDVILPLTVLRRLDCVLQPTKQKVLETQAKFRGKLENLDGLLREASGFAFYNTSRYDFESLLADAPHLAQNLRNYIAGFSPNMREVLEKFDFDNTISKLDEAGLLFQVVQEFRQVDLHPDRVDNLTMGTIFEELIRKFNEALNENPGEHFTPRDVIHLMVDLMLLGDERRLAQEGLVVTVYDPCCGSGGMLTIAKEHLVEGERRETGGGSLKPAVSSGKAQVRLFGQEVNPETYAICKSDLFMKDPTGGDAGRIAYGSVLSADRHAGRSFDYMIANPPYGKDWKRDQDAVRAEHERGAAGRFGPGLPPIDDGQLLFLMHMVAHMKDPMKGGSRMAVITNGSPLFSGDAGQGESEIRRWLFENDLVEAIIALPEDLFYNTNIATYVWLITNRKDARKRGKVQLIDATRFWKLLRKNLGKKRREIPFEAKEDILAIVRAFQDGTTQPVGEEGSEREVVVSRVFPTSHFGFRKIVVHRPLRLDFRASPERLARLEEENAFAKLVVSRKRDPEARAKDEVKGRARQEGIRRALARLDPGHLYLDQAEFLADLEAALQEEGVRLTKPLRKAILDALSERNEEAAICRDEHGNPVPDPELKDTERVPIPDGEDTVDLEGVHRSVRDYFEREVLPYAPDAWIDTTQRDPLDGHVGLVGYKVHFNREFYEFRPPRPLEAIEADLQAIEAEIQALLQGGSSGSGSL